MKQLFKMGLLFALFSIGLIAAGAEPLIDTGPDDPGFQIHQMDSEFDILVQDYEILIQDYEFVIQGNASDRIIVTLETKPTAGNIVLIPPALMLSRDWLLNKRYEPRSKRVNRDSNYLINFSQNLFASSLLNRLE